MNSRNRPEPVQEVDVVIRKSLKALVHSHRPALDVRQMILRKAYAQRRSWFWPAHLAPVWAGDEVKNYRPPNPEPNVHILIYFSASRLFRPMSFPGQIL